MNFTLKNRPACEKCEVFTSDKTRSSTVRAIFCEGLRAVGKCPKDEWFESFEKELRELSRNYAMVKIKAVLGE